MGGKLSLLTLKELEFQLRACEAELSCVKAEITRIDSAEKKINSETWSYDLHGDLGCGRVWRRRQKLVNLERVLVERKVHLSYLIGEARYSNATIPYTPSKYSKMPLTQLKAKLVTTQALIEALSGDLQFARGLHLKYEVHNNSRIFYETLILPDTTYPIENRLRKLCRDEALLQGYVAMRTREEEEARLPAYSSEA